jgi:hypothetical protein
MKTHKLKTLPEYFKALKEGSKPFEIRKNDTDFQVGDELTLAEWDPIGKKETGHYVGCRVTYVLDSSSFPEGLKDGYVIMGTQIKEVWINPNLVPYPEVFTRESWKMGAVGVMGV